MSEPPDPPPPPPPAPPRQPSVDDIRATVTQPMPALKQPPPATGWFRRFAGLWGFALFLAVVAFLFRSVLVPFLFAIVIAYVLAPAVNRLSALRVGRRRLPRGAAVIFCYIFLLVGISVFVLSFLPRLSADFVRFGREAPRIWERAQNEWTPRAARWIEKHFPSLAPDLERKTEPPPPTATLTELPPPPGTVLTVTPMANGDLAITLPPGGIEIDHAGTDRIVVRQREVNKQKSRLEDVLRERMVKVLVGLEGQVAEVLKLGQALVVGIFAAIAQLVIVLLVAAYILVDLSRLHAFARSVVPERHRADYDAIVRGIDRGMNGVVRGQLLICLINGFLTYIGLLIFQVNYGLLLAAIVAVMSLIPIFGTIASTIPIVFLAFFSDGGADPVRALAMLAWVLGVHFVESSFLGPKIMGHQAKMHPVLVIFALIAGAETYGVVGAVLSVPIASVIQTFFLFFRSRAWRIDAASSTMPTGIIR
jgi:predicted PurR-regulated permease PerM